MKVLVTGGNDLVGRALIKAFHKKGIDVRSIDLAKSEFSGVESYSGSILDGDSRKGCFTDVRAHRSGIRQCGLRVWPHDGLGIIAS